MALMAPPEAMAKAIDLDPTMTLTPMTETHTAEEATTMMAMAAAPTLEEATMMRDMAADPEEATMTRDMAADPPPMAAAPAMTMTSKTPMVLHPTHGPATRAMAPQSTRRLSRATPLTEDPPTADPATTDGD